VSKPTYLLVTILAVSIAACGGDSDSANGQAATSFVSDQRIIYSDGLHSENTEMIRLGARILLVFRGGEQGQTGSSRAHINIFESTDEGRTFTPLSEVNANNLPGDRDIRDPKLVEMHGTLFLYAISRLPGTHYRDLFGQAWTVRADSTDGGRTWTLPVKTYADVVAGGSETFWGFWRFTKRQYVVDGEPRETLFATAYNDGDIAVSLFASDDGLHWEKRGLIMNSYADVPSEAELQFFGANNETAVALVRLDNQDILADGQTAICTSTDPFTTWECGRRIEQRLDGPTWVVRGTGNQARHFVFARKHLPCTFKRTAAYELRGDLTDPRAAIEVCEIQELESSGDTAYTAVVRLSANQSLLSWYSSPVAQELPWLEGQFSPSDIWLATVNVDAAPATCVHPVPERPCTLPPLPPASTVFDITGQHFLTVAPVIWPAQSIFFQAHVVVHGATLDMELQPLDALTKEPVGPSWSANDVPISTDGSFAANFGTRGLPPPAFPLFADPFLRLGDFVLTGKTTSPDAFCGYATGYAQVVGNREADQIRLEGSTFGAARMTGNTLPMPLSSCAPGGAERGQSP
jgi:hypothetical protein